MSKTEELERLLNCSDLKNEWYLSYGITEDWNEDLTAEEDDGFDYSLLNRNSETALTLFMLGDIDRWNQINAFKTNPGDPRKKDGSSWNEFFFAKIRESQDVFQRAKDDILWTNLDIEGKDFRKSILLFEFEIVNSAFCPVGDNKAFKKLSFLDISERPRWSEFDAVLVVPDEELFIFFESKLTGDIKKGVKGFDKINQLERYLESGFLLTKHKGSPYEDWKFRFVFICPKEEYDKADKEYPAKLNNLKKTIDEYEEKLRDDYWDSVNRESYEKYFDSFRKRFRKENSDSVSVIYWDELGDVLRSENEDFFDEYLSKLQDSEEEKARERFEKAGIELS